MKQLVLAAFLACAVLAANAAQKVLRIPFLAAETNFDPVFVSDLYSNSVTMEIFEAPLTYDFLARPTARAGGLAVRYVKDTGREPRAV